MKCCACSSQEELPEGRQVCYNCEENANDAKTTKDNSTN